MTPETAAMTMHVLQDYDGDVEPSGRRQRCLFQRRGLFNEVCDTHKKFGVAKNGMTPDKANHRGGRLHDSRMPQTLEANKNLS
jgi:hypothetical protein